ncbi:MAG: site-specific integrase [Cyanobacteria bacterium J06573_11]
MDISTKIETANARLKAQLVRIKIGQARQTLHLRGTLPPREGSGKSKPYQQRIYINVPANLEGLRAAEREAKLVAAQLINKEFDWSRYTKPDDQPVGSCGDWIKKLHYWYIHEKGGRAETWEGDYIKGLKGLRPTATLTPATLERAILSTKPNSRSRQRTCMAVGALAKFAKLDFDVSPFRGSYSPSKTAIRNVPSCTLVSEYREKITNPGWRWVYGMMATYGLRNHEVFKLDLDDFPIVHIFDETKTGSREVWPCYPEWAERWGLESRVLPGIDLERTNQKIGHSVTEYLSPKLPFTPYDLRHAWAVRTISFGWPDALSAQQMGHSLIVHNNTYQRWISKRDHQKMYDILVNREDRPRAP